MPARIKQHLRSHPTLAIVVAALAAMMLIAAVSEATHGQTVANALGPLNGIRARRGLYPYQPRSDLQAQAEYESKIRAHRRINGHLRNGCRPGVAEGVGWQSVRDHYGRNFHTCYYLARGYRYAGAAVAVSASGQAYYTLILR